MEYPYSYHESSFRFADRNIIMPALEADAVTLRPVELVRAEGLDHVSPDSRLRETMVFPPRYSEETGTPLGVGRDLQVVGPDPNEQVAVRIERTTSIAQRHDGLRRAR